MPTRALALASSAHWARAATSSWAPCRLSSLPETSAGVRRTTVELPVRVTTTLNPSARRRAMASSSTGRVSDASSMVFPSWVIPTAPGSSPPWPASSTTVYVTIPLGRPEGHTRSGGEGSGIEGLRLRRGFDRVMGDPAGISSGESHHSHTGDGAGHYQHNDDDEPPAASRHLSHQTPSEWRHRFPGSISRSHVNGPTSGITRNSSGISCN